MAAPLATPLAGDTEIHEGAPVTDHAHPDPAETVIVDDWPAAATDSDVGATANEQLGVTGAAAWVTVNVCPAIVTVLVRAPAVFAATDSETVAEPDPLPEPATVIQGTAGTADQAQFAGATIEVVAEPPAAATLADAGAIV